jgi:hypothetical protein
LLVGVLVVGPGGLRGQGESGQGYGSARQPHRPAFFR